MKKNYSPLCRAACWEAAGAGLCPGARIRWQCCSGAQGDEEGAGSGTLSVCRSLPDKRTGVGTVIGRCSHPVVTLQGRRNEHPGFSLPTL